MPDSPADNRIMGGRHWLKTPYEQGNESLRRTSGTRSARHANVNNVREPIAEAATLGMTSQIFGCVLLEPTAIFQEGLIREL